MIRPQTLGLAVLAGFVLIVSSGCHGKSPGEQAAKSTRTRVTAVKPERKTIRRSFTQPGQIEAFDQARVYAKIPAYVEKYYVDIGDVVTGPREDESGKVTKRGQLLVALSAPELDQELEQKKALVIQAGADVEQAQVAIKVADADALSAKARLKEATAAVDRFEADYQRWYSEYNRVVQLVSKSAVTPKLADETKAQMLAADASRKEAEAKVESAQAAAVASRAQVEKSMADEAAMRARRQVAEADEARAAALVKYLKIEAPFDGVVSERNADIGYFAEAGGGSQAKPLFTVVRIDPVRVFVNVPETDASLVDEGDAAVVRVGSLRGREFAGTVTRSSYALDVTTRTLHTEVDIPNPDGQLRPGMYALVTIDLAEHENACTVPLAAIVEQDGRTWCFVVEDGKSNRKAVSVGLASGGEVEISSGLTGDELVIVGKGGSLKDGQAVEVVEAAPAR